MRYDAARRALAAAVKVDEVKEIRDAMEAMRAYARQANNKEMELQAWELRTRAERRLGELIKAQKETVGLAQGRRSDLVSKKNQVPKATLSEALGMDPAATKKLSSRAQKLASVPERKFEKIMDEARARVMQENERVTARLLKESEIVEERREYKERIIRGATVSDLHGLIAAEKKFAVIYADPAWEFQVYSGKGKQRSAERHYDTCSLNEIKSLPVQSLTTDDCALFLWCVMPELPGALEVINAWGFTYKTAGFVWIKENRSGEGLFTGMGFWTRANAEMCLFATKGSPKRLAMDVHQIVMSPVGEHSQKPAEVRRRIERLLAGPYLELYGRDLIPAWTVWGNEVVALEATE